MVGRLGGGLGGVVREGVSDWDRRSPEDLKPKGRADKSPKSHKGRADKSPKSYNGQLVHKYRFKQILEDEKNNSQMA